jgi:hypothetical protein
VGCPPWQIAGLAGGTPAARGAKAKQTLRTVVTVAAIAVANHAGRQASGEFVTWEVSFSPLALAGGRPLAPRGAPGSAPPRCPRRAAPQRPGVCALSVVWQPFERTPPPNARERTARPPAGPPTRSPRCPRRAPTSSARGRPPRRRVGTLVVGLGGWWSTGHRGEAELGASRGESGVRCRRGARRVGGGLRLRPLSPSRAPTPSPRPGRVPAYARLVTRSCRHCAARRARLGRALALGELVTWEVSFSPVARGRPLAPRGAPGSASPRCPRRASPPALGGCALLSTYTVGFSAHPPPAAGTCAGARAVRHAITPPLRCPTRAGGAARSRSANVSPGR